MVSRITRRDSADTIVQMEAAARRLGAAEGPDAHSAQACARTFLRSWTEDGRLARGRRLLAQACQRDFGDAGTKRKVLGAAVDALQEQSPKFEQAWTALTRPEGPYGLPPSVTLAHVARQPAMLRQNVCANRVQQWERDFRLQLATSGVLARLVLLRAGGLSQDVLAALAAQPVGIERSVAYTLKHTSAAALDVCDEASYKSKAAVPVLSMEEWARWHALVELDCAQQVRGQRPQSEAVRSMLAASRSGDRTAFCLRVRALIAAFAGVDVAASIVFYRSAAGQAWLAKQTELSHTELGELWDAIDRHTQRIDRWIRTMMEATT